MNCTAADFHAVVDRRLMDFLSIKTGTAKARNERRVNVDNQIFPFRANNQLSHKSRHDDKVALILLDQFVNCIGKGVIGIVRFPVNDAGVGIAKRGVLQPRGGWRAGNDQRKTDVSQPPGAFIVQQVF